jgi:hypothetical protein
MYKIPILKSANAIFSPKEWQSKQLNIKLKIGAKKKQPSWHWLVEQAL